MNRITQIFKQSIINKIILMICLILLSVCGILSVNILSFVDVKNSLESIIDRDVARVIKNTRVNDNIRNTIARSDLLINTFTERENTLVDEKNRLIAEIEADIKFLVSEVQPSQNIFKDFITRLNFLFNHCARVNEVLIELHGIEKSLDTALADLDDIVVEKDLVVGVDDSDEADSIRQLAIMLPGYREIFFETIIEFINAKSNYLGTKEIRHNYEQKILKLLDEFDVGLSSMPIAWNEIFPYVRNLMTLTSGYKVQIVKAFESMRKFRDQLGLLKQSQKQVLAEISIINAQILENTGAIRIKTSENITASIRTTLLLSASIIIILFFIGIVSVRLAQPLKELSIGAGKIGAGDLNYRVKIDSADEIGYLSASFNRMTANLRETTVSKEYVQNILKSMNEALIVLTPQGGIKSVNQATLDLLGYEKMELVGQPVDKILAGAKESKIGKQNNSSQSEVQALVEHPFTENKEKTFVGKDDRTIPVLFSASPMPGPDETIQGIVCVATDITNLKQVESALRDSESNYRNLFNAEPDAIIIADAETKRIVDVNPAGLKLYGYSYEQICGIEVLNLSAEPHQSEKHIEQALLEATIEGSREIVQRLHKRKDGTVFPVEIAHGFYYRKGRRMICAILRDISKRKQMEDALAAEKESLAVTLRSIGDGVISTDLEGKIISVNKVAETLTGWKEKETIGKPLGQVFHIVNELNRKRCENPVRKVLETGGMVELANNTVLIGKDGTEHIIADSGAPILDRHSKIIGAVLVFRDITERRKMEQELTKVKKLESLGVLAGGIAHDFNNFLTAIIGNLSLAKLESKPGDPIVSQLNEMENAALQAKNLTQQLLTFSKGGEPVKKLVNLSGLIKNSATFSLHGSNVRCDFSLPEDLQPVDG